MSTGETKTGEAKTGEGGTTVRTIDLNGVTDKTGEAPRGQSPTGDQYGSGATELDLTTPAPAATAAGTASATVPTTTLSLSTTAPDFVYVLSPPSQTLALTTPDPGLTGVGAVGVAAPTTTLSLSSSGHAIGFPFWQIDGDVVEGLIAETRTWQTLDLTVRVDDDTLADELRPLRATAEKVAVVTDSDGGFSTIDRAATDGVHTLTPPVGRSPPRTEREYLVGQYAQRALDQSNSGHEVSVSFVAQTDREPGSHTDEARASDEWAFAFRSATITTDRVQYDLAEATDTAAGTVELTLVLDATQTEILEASASRLAAVSVREVPDGANTFDDNAPNDANTVAVTTPDGEAPIPEQDYVVREWTTEWVSDRAYRVAMTLGSP